jgi:1-acyl-sn-glycerol-3-phosphate acyltransferase
MMKLISKIYLWLIGWKIDGRIPPEVRKCVLVAVPHTSNLDFPIARAVLYVMDVNLRYLIKKEWIRFPLGPLLKASGAIAVDRQQNTNLVESIIEIINNADDIVVAIPAEGTRKLVKKWKLGFYYVALGAGVPIVLSYLDYEKKIGGIGPTFYPTGNLVEDMQQIREFYKNIVPRHPENVSLEII